ncbi:MAG: hypothetical protein LCH78_21660, partial [Proteobacteria bacterium]|nr:hypothetical protein [Pseudomonadota bacterium]
MNNKTFDSAHTSRRGVLATGLSLAAIGAAPALLPALPTSAQAAPSQASKGSSKMSSGFVTTKDGVQIFYKDWGPKSAQPIVFHHGWP